MFKSVALLCCALLVGVYCKDSNKPESDSSQVKLKSDSSPVKLKSDSSQVKLKSDSSQVKPNSDTSQVKPKSDSSYERMPVVPPLGVISNIEESKSAEGQTNPQPCCYPPVLNAEFSEISTLRIYRKRVGNMSIDANNMNYAEDYTVFFNDGTQLPESYLVNIDGKTGKGFEYIFWKQLKECMYSPLFNATLDSYRCVPKEAKYRGDISIGISQGGSSLRLSSWSWTEYEVGETREHTWFVTAHDCAPAIDLFGSKLVDKPHEALIEKYDYNVQTKVDPQVFVPPSYCSHFTDDSLFQQMGGRWRSAKNGADLFRGRPYWFH